MGGGFLQLAAYGAQDLYLTGNPQISYFIMVYKRYTNFAIENCRQYFTGHADFGKKVYCQIERIGDLMSQTFISVKLPSLKPYFKEGVKYYWVNAIGHALIEQVDIEIGGKVIDRHYGVWLQIWIELTLPSGKYSAYKKMVGYTNDTCYFDYEGEVNLYIPLQFWFCRNIGLSLPLIALQNHQVRINCSFRDVRNLLVKVTDDYHCGKADLNFNEINMDSAYVFVDYVFLEDGERRRFAQRTHQYLIEQLQINSSVLYSRGRKDNPMSSAVDILETCPLPDDIDPDCAQPLPEHKVAINFNHPVIELLWVFQNSAVLGLSDDNKRYNANEIFNFGIKNCCERDTSGNCCSRRFKIYNNGDYTMSEATLYIEGKERFERRDGKYFNVVQPYQRHRNVPPDFIYNYSFSIYPEEVKPSGSCNFSRIDNCHFVFKLNNELINPHFTIFARNYNILTIKAGMAGVRYSN